jgi:predicted amidohydrolase YtcJ
VTDATLFVGGRVFTGRRYVEALLVEAGKVVATGPEASVRRDTPTGADRVDLRAVLVVPGLADAHLHLGEMTRTREGFDAREPRSIEQLGARLRKWSEDHPHGAVVGRGLDFDALAERRAPTASELDAAVADRPVVLYHASGHAAVANTLTLERAFGGGGSISPPGTAPGLVVEEALEALRPIVQEALPLLPHAMEATVRELTELGITAVGTMNTGAAELSILKELDAAGRLPIRVRAYPSIDRVSEFRAPGGRGARNRLQVVGVKGFLDGAFGPRTAALRDGYADAPASRGVERGLDAELGAALEMAHLAGLAVALHAIGDRAVARASRLLSGASPRDPPDRIEHASLTPPDLVAELRPLGGVLAVQPGFVLSDTWLADRLGPGRARWAYAFRTLSDLGIALAGSSDAPYDPPDPWRGMRAAVRRQDELGRSANPWPDQALSEPEALALYTTGSHRAIGIDAGGELEPGAPADLVILSCRSLGEAIVRGGSVVRETWVSGRRLPRADTGVGRDG